jgi:hypothetical protein
MYRKYLKYKKKYLDLKYNIELNGGDLSQFLKNKNEPLSIVLDENLNEKINILYENIHDNEFYKNIYNKFIYLPIKNNIQIVLKYYPNPYCSYDEELNSITDKCYYQIDSKNNDNKYLPEKIKNTEYIGYFRENNHLKNMFDIDYYNFITYGNYVIGTKNIILKNININPIPYIIWRNYMITPTLYPVHNNHVIIVKIEYNRAAEFYFPDETLNVLKDMFDFSKLTKQYIYNSIELGSIPEIIHYHTSSEIPPMNNITKMIENQEPLLQDDNIKLYLLNIDEYMCHCGYYFEIEDEGLNIVIDNLPRILFNSINVDDESSKISYKYLAQIFILPKLYDFHRLIITFKRVPIDLAVPDHHGFFKEEYYISLYGKKEEICYGPFIKFKDNLRYNILGYESILINYSNNPIEALDIDRIDEIKNYCNDKTFELLNKNCLNLFHYNKLFEANIKIIFKQTNIRNKIYNNILKFNGNIQNHIYEIRKIDKIYDINQNVFLAKNNNNLYTFEKINDINNINKNINISNNIYELFPIFMAKPLSVVTYVDNIYLVRKNILSTIQNHVTLIDKERSTLYGILIFILHILYSKFEFIFENIELDDILVMKVPNKTKNFLGLRYNILEKYILTYNEHNNNIPILTNLHKINKGDITSYNKSLVRLKQVMTPIYITHHELTNRNELYDQFHITINNYHNRYSYDKINRFLQSNFNMNIESFTKYILSNSSKYIKEMNKDVYFTFPKGTHFIMGTSFKDTKDINFDFAPENTWYYDIKQTQWFTSNYDLDIFIKKLNDFEQKKYSEIKLKGLYGCNADWYIGNNPFNIGRHLIFKTTKDLKMFVSSFDVTIRKKKQNNLIIMILNDIIENNKLGKKKFNTLQINDDFAELETHELYKILPFQEDTIYTLICEVYKYNNILDYDGYFGSDYISKNRLNNNYNINIEYVLFDPNMLKFLGVYHYNYYTSKYVLYRNIDDWLYQLRKLIKNYKYTETTAEKQLQDKIRFTSGNRETTYIDIFNYEEINKYYIENLIFILDDKLILKNNDFWNGENKPVDFLDNIMQ